MNKFCISTSIASMLLMVFWPSASLADADFWQPAQTGSTATKVVGGNSDSGLFTSLASTQQVDIDGRTSRQQRVSLQQALSEASSFMMEYARAREQQSWVMGYRHGDLTLSMMRGSGDDYSKLGGEYQGVDPYLFHGGNGQHFKVSGFAVDYSAGRFGHLQYGQAKVLSKLLEDRTARYLEWSTDAYFARATRFARGNQQIGYGLDLGVAFANKRIALQTMNLDNDRKMQRIRLEFNGNQNRQYWLDLSAHQNPLFEAKNDYRLMFHFKTLLGARQLASYQNDTVSSDEEAAIEDEAANPASKQKKKGKGWNRALIIGGGVAAAAALASSGSSGADNQNRFEAQNAAAKQRLDQVNPPSIRENREYGGWVFLNPDGSFGTSEAARGDQSSVRLPDPATSVPIGSQITASYHTHAAFDPRFDNENFSPRDLQNDRDNMIDGYLGTPLGQFKVHVFATDEIIVLGTVATE